MKNKKYFILIELILAVYMEFLLVEKKVNGQNEYPIIEVSDYVQEVSVSDDQKIFLQDIKAYDKEDGDLTEDIFVENISVFNENYERTVTYTVIDSNNAVSRAYRNISYTDYQEPELYIKSPLVSTYWENPDEVINCIGAKSVIDGDISNKIVIDSYQGDERHSSITFSVTDSSGATTTETYKITMLNNMPTIDIKLSQYSMVVKQGTNLDPYDYIQEISENDIKSDDFSDVEIRTDYDPEVPGTYEIIYEMNKINGNFGLTKLVVVVE